MQAIVQLKSMHHQAKSLYFFASIHQLQKKSIQKGAEVSYMDHLLSPKLHEEASHTHGGI